MKTMIIAAAAISLGINSAHADGGESVVANTQFTQIPGVVAPAQAPDAQAIATAQNQTHTPVIEAEHSTAKTAIGNIH